MTNFEFILDDLNKWKNEITNQIERMLDSIQKELTQTLNDLQDFCSITNALLIEQEHQFERAIDNEQIDLIEKRIEQILPEIEFLQTLFLQINTESIRIPHRLEIHFNNTDLRSISSLFIVNKTYRFLITRLDALQMQEYSLPSTFHLTSCHNEFINECILTFNVSNFDEFLHAFDFYWHFISHKYQFHLLIPQIYISLIIGKLGETSRLLTQRYQLDQIKVFTNRCPKSDERILFISCQIKQLMKDCLKEIYTRIENKSQQNSNIQLYNPANLTEDDIKKIRLMNIDYGGFFQTKISTINNEDKDIWNEIDRLIPSYENTIENIQREINIPKHEINIIIGVNAQRIDRIKQITGAYVYITGEIDDPERTVIIKGTRGQVERAYRFIENLIEKYRIYKLPPATTKRLIDH